jgi:hypothetical protein
MVGQSVARLQVGKCLDVSRCGFQQVPPNVTNVWILLHKDYVPLPPVAMQGVGGRPRKRLHNGVVLRVWI